MPPPVRPFWASAPTFVVGAGVPAAIVGSPTKVAPNAAQLDQGNVPGLGFIGEHENWWKDQIEGFLQWFLDRTPGGTWMYETPVLHQKVHTPQTAWSINSAPEWTHYDGPYVEALGNQSKLVTPLVGYPVGCSLTGLQVRARTNNGSGTRTQEATVSIWRNDVFRLFDLTPLSTFPFIGGANSVWNKVPVPGFPGTFYEWTLPPGSGAEQVIDLMVGSPPMPFDDGTEYVVLFTSGTDSVPPITQDRLWAYMSLWSEPGPRSGSV